MAVARRLALGARQRRVVGVAERDDVAGDPRPVGPTTDWIGVGDDDRVLAAQADAGPPVPGEFHRLDSDTARLHDGSPARRCAPEMERPEAPAQSAPPVGGREDGTLWVRPTTTLRRALIQASRRQAVKKATTLAGPPQADRTGPPQDHRDGRGESPTSCDNPPMHDRSSTPRPIVVAPRARPRCRRRVPATPARRLDASPSPPERRRRAVRRVRSADAPRRARRPPSTRPTRSYDAIETPGRRRSAASQPTARSTARSSTRTQLRTMLTADSSTRTTRRRTSPRTSGCTRRSA